MIDAVRLIEMEAEIARFASPFANDVRELIAEVRRLRAEAERLQVQELRGSVLAQAYLDHQKPTGQCCVCGLEHVCTVSGEEAT